MAKKKATAKKVAKKAVKKAVPAPEKAPEPKELLTGSFMQRSYGAQYRWAWDGEKLSMRCNRKVPAVALRMDFGPEASSLNFSGGKASPDADGVFRFNLNEPDMREGWVFVPEGSSEPPAVGLG